MDNDKPLTHTQSGNSTTASPQPRIILVQQGNGLSIKADNVRDRAHMIMLLTGAIDAVVQEWATEAKDADRPQPRIALPSGLMMPPGLRKN